MSGYDPILRPWLKAGLSVLLLDDEQRVKSLMAAGGQGKDSVPEGPASAPVPSSPRIGLYQPTPEAEPLSSRKASQGDKGSLHGRKTPALSSSMPKEPAAVVPSLHVAASAVPGVLPESSWPVSWRALRERRPLPASPRVLWTYAGLGDDLMGEADPGRRQVIARMIMALKHPGGTHVFWPYVLPGEDFSEQPSLFWSGVEKLDPRVLLILGSDARDALSLPRTLLPFCQERLYGRLVIQLPRPQSFADSEAAFARVLAFLANSLRFCSRR